MKSFPPFRLDPANHYLWRVSETGEARQIAIRPRAFKLLSYLADHPGRPVPLEELLDALWPGAAIQPEVVKAQILAIRTALDDRSDPPRFIETLRGRGYRFIGRFEEAPAPGEGMAAQPGLIGRGESLAALAARLDAARRGVAQIVFLSGEPGIGKTALLDRFLAGLAGDASLLVARGQCVEGFGGTEPYYPVLEALARLCDGAQGSEIRKRLISIAPTLALQLPAQIPAELRRALRQEVFGARQERMLREASELLAGLAQRHLLVIGLEDLHWADYSTVDLISALARRPGGMRLMIVGTFRREDALAGVHPVEALRRTLRLSDKCYEIALTGLDEQAVGDLVADRGGQPAGGDFVRNIHDWSGGNPLFITAALDHLAEIGARGKAAGCPDQPPSSPEFDVPQTLGQVVEQRLCGFLPLEVRVLEAASVAGLGFDAEIVAAAAELSAEEVEDICEGLCRKAGFIQRSGEGSVAERTYSFRHGVYRQVLLERQGRLRLSRAHLAIGNAIEAMVPPNRRGTWAPDLTRHFAAAQDWPRALAYLRLTVRTATQRFADREALAILDRAAGLSRHLPDSDRIRMELELLEGRASILAAAHAAESEDAFRRLAAAAEAQGEIDTQIRALLGLAYTLGWRDRDQCVDLLDRVLELGARQSGEIARARTRLSANAWKIWARGWDEALYREFAEALAVIEASEASDGSSWARIEHSMIAMLSSRYDEVPVEIQRGYEALVSDAEVRPEFNAVRVIWMRSLGVPWAHLCLGQLGDSLREFDNGIALLAKNGNAYAAASLGLYRGWLLLYCRDYEGVLAFCREILPDCDGDPGPATAAPSLRILPAELRHCLLLAGLARAGLGDFAEARRLLAEVERQMRDIPVIFDWYWRLPLERGLSGLAIAAGDREEARRHADLAVELACRAPERTWLSLAWETSARVALLEEDPGKAADHIGKALDAAQGGGAVLSEPIIQATAAIVQAALGDRQAARRHAEKAQALKAALLDTMPESLSVPARRP